MGTIAVMEQYSQEWRGYRPIEPRGGFDWRAALRRLGAPLAAIGAFLAKFGVALLKFKFLFSMFVSAAFYVWLGGWWFGIGLIALLFVHEMGHVLEAKRQGLPVSVPVFIPFMGALITMKQMPHNAWREARLALAGPLLGSAGALLLYILALVYDSPQLTALAFLGFLLNLFPARPARARHLPTKPDPDHYPAARRLRASPTLADPPRPADAGLLPGTATATAPDRRALLRTRSRARGRHARHPGAAQLLAEQTPTQPLYTTAGDSQAVPRSARVRCLCPTQGCSARH